MNFDDSNKAIYLQIADRLSDEILAGKYPDDARLPSVREFAADIQVNANTVMRSYDRLQQDGVIYNRRGIGFFVSPGAREKIMAEKTDTLMRSKILTFFEELRLLGISPDQLKDQYLKFLNDKNKS
ncbi:MAG: GntR family transcriptional regulator [Muribaculaceae bacterium]|nr:GntR family transcriptional regulator [Muribaculaceae bacterium]